MDVKLLGWKEFEAKMGRYPQIAEPEMKKAMEKSVITVQTEARKLAPVNIGELRASIATEVKSVVGKGVEGVVGTNVKYGPAVELGGKPHWPPRAPILFWVTRKLGLSGREAVFAAMNIQKAIAAGGTRAQPFLEPALNKSEDLVNGFFNLALKNILKVIG